MRSPVSLRVPVAHLIAVLALGFVAAWLFRDHLLGHLLFLGNPDRLNHNLKLTKFYVESIASGAGIHAWNEAEMLGYDALAQPYIFPSPLTYLVALGGLQNLYVTAGIVSATLLGVAGMTAYWYAHRLLADSLLSFVAAVLYQCSALSILKVSQNELSFMVIVLIPVIAALIHRANRDNLASSYVLGSLFVFFLLQFCFVQKVAYALLFAAAYSMLRTCQLGSWRVFLMFCASAVTGLLAAAPRSYGLAFTMSEYVRVQPEETIATFDDLFRYQGIFWYQILRWFEDGIFGRFFADDTAILNGLNLSEGFLLYTSPMVPLIVIAGLLGRQANWNGSIFGPITEARFLVWFALFTFAAALLKPVNYLLHLGFLKVDFVHARILVAGLLPMVVYAAMYLRALKPDGRDPFDGKRILLAGATAIVATVIVELLAGSVQGSWRMQALLERAVSAPAGVRVIASAVAFAVLVTAILRSKLPPTLRRAAHTALCATVALQAIIGANFRLNGEHTRGTELPFRSGDIYFAEWDAFRIPSETDTRALHDRVESDSYRGVVVCDPRSAGGFCAAHIAQFWNLRLADGYYGIGVPARIAMLPWSVGLGLRHILFVSLDTLPWDLLGFLNVRYVLVQDQHLYQNSPDTDAGRSVRIAINPAPVVPRAFFADSILPAASPDEAKRLLFGGSRMLSPERISVVEGIASDKQFQAAGAIELETGPDRLILSFAAADRERFLVVNELFTLRWRATVDGQPARIYPTNLVMRGILVPAGASRVTMEYLPVVRSLAADITRGVAAMLLLFGVVVFRSKR